MTSKTFKSATGRSLTIEPSDGHDIGLATAGSFLALKIEDAPALALAILEAAGYTDSSKGGIIDKVSNAMFLLKEHVKKQERATADARERAELEAEALELYKTYWSGNVTGFSNEPNRDDWLAVARRARELAKEATK